MTNFMDTYEGSVPTFIFSTDKIRQKYESIEHTDILRIMFDKRKQLPNEQTIFEKQNIR